MRRSRATSNPQDATGENSRSPRAFVAHELNSLLDGSIRNIALALRRLELSTADGTDDAPLAEIAAKLQSAQTAMTQMAELLAQSLRPNAQAVGSFDVDLTLQDVIERIVGWVEPAAAQGDISIGVRIEPAAALLPGGVLGPLILNGLRNAVEAALASGGHGVVQVTAAVPAAPRLLTLQIVNRSSDKPDHPAAPRRAGHGIGLEVVRSIVMSLGGSMSLHIDARGQGAFRVRVPIDRLIQT